HERDPKLVEAECGDRHADDAPPVGGHEVHGLGRDILGSHDEVAFVLSIRVVDDDHHPAGPDVQQGLLDGREHGMVHRRLRCSAHVRAPSAVEVRSRSTYFARTSTSRFTDSPTRAVPSVVTASVSGIRATENASPFRPATVSDTPSTDAEPFSTRYRRSSAGGRMVSHAPPVGSASTPTTSPTPSTWPCTRWPPNRVASVTGRSRFTGSPGDRRARPVRRIVSSDRSNPR